jgi:hypothetical protein
VHNGSHPNFDGWVTQQLQAAEQRVTRRLPLDEVTPEVLDSALRDVENLIRQAIRNKTLPEKALKELEGGGQKLGALPFKLKTEELA